jgi:hypothetical protein
VRVGDAAAKLVERAIAYGPLPAVEIFKRTIQPKRVGAASQNYWEYWREA